MDWALSRTLKSALDSNSWPSRAFRRHLVCIAAAADNTTACKQGLLGSLLTSSPIARSQAHEASVPLIEAAQLPAYKAGPPDHTLLLAEALLLPKSPNLIRLEKGLSSAACRQAVTGPRNAGLAEPASSRVLLTPPYKLEGWLCRQQQDVRCGDRAS